MTFSFRPAVRDRVGLLIGIAGPSGSGKTLSALRLARGLAGGDDSKIAVLDTEGGRAKHYAVAPGETPGPSRFAFAHGDLAPPFSPERYQEAIVAADTAGFEVVLIDSMSHVWAGEGGVQDMHDANVAAAVERRREFAREKGWRFDEAAEREKASIGAWNEPKQRLKRMVARLLQVRAHLVICMRADEKMRMETVEEEGRAGKVVKKTVIIAAKDLPPAERWAPIIERRFPYELTTSLLVTPLDPGVPVPLKLQEQHRHAFPEGRQITEETGRLLAEWARGGGGIITPRSASEPEAGASPPPKPAAGTPLSAAADPASGTITDGPEVWDYEDALADALAGEDPAVLLAWWKETADRRASFAEPLRRAMQARVKARADELRGAG